MWVALFEEFHGASVNVPSNTKAVRRRRSRESEETWVARNVDVDQTNDWGREADLEILTDGEAARHTLLR